ncbi:MAG: arylesterase [Vicinamibacterales bacterium]
MRRTAAAALVLLVSAPPAAAPIRAAEPVRIVAFGDSLTSGHRLPEEEAYPARLEERLEDAGFDVSVINHGVSGDTSAGGVRRLDAALGEKPHILIVEFGANDGLRGVPVAQVRRNLETIIQAAQQQGARVVLCAMDALPVNGWQYTLDFHNLYYDLAEQYKVPLAPNPLAGVLGNRDLMSPDGVHPNREGAKVLADTIYPEVLDVVRQLGRSVAD